MIRVGDRTPPCDHPLLGFDNVPVSPCTAGITRETRFTIEKIAGEQVLAAIDRNCSRANQSASVAAQAHRIRPPKFWICAAGVAVLPALMKRASGEKAS